MKLKSFGTAKENINGMKRQPTELGKYWNTGKYSQMM